MLTVYNCLKDGDLLEFRTANLQLMKEWNLSLLLKLIRHEPSISRAKLTAKTNLSPTTVSSLVAELIKNGLVREIGIGESAAGRKPILLELIPNGRIALGIIINHDGIMVAPVNLIGQPLMIYKEQANLDDSQDIIEKIIAGIELSLKYLEEHHLSPSLAGAGIGVLGLVEGHKTRYLLGDDWHSFDLKPLLERYKNQFTFAIENDVNAMALGETWFGIGEEKRHVLYVYLGYGLGAGLIINGNLYRGAYGNAGELGHMSISSDGQKCSCGLVGCLGPVSDGTHVLLKIKEALKNGEPTRMTLNNLSLETFISGALDGDPLGKKILDEMILNVSVGVISAINLLNPSLVILGGMLCPPDNIVSDKLINNITKCSIEGHRNGFKVVASNLGTSAGVVGAATLVLKNLFELPAYTEKK